VNKDTGREVMGRYQNSMFQAAMTAESTFPPKPMGCIIMINYQAGTAGRSSKLKIKIIQSMQNTNW